MKEGKVAGTDEYIEGKANITPNGEAITVKFAEATRNYSRLRIATMPNKPITVSINKYTPAGSSDMKWDQNYALTSDEKGNAYLDVDEETLDAINIGLQDARYWSINLTLIGCKKIPSGGFMHFDMLKSIVLPDVTEIGENAFSDCSGLQKVVLGNLTKVYGNVRNNGIFDGCETRSIDLVLSKDQKAMNDGEAEGRYCWTADIITDYDLSVEHVSKKFLGYEFKSITCRYKFE